MFVTWMLAATFWAAGGEPESSPFPGESPSPISSLTLRLTTAKIERTERRASNLDYSRTMKEKSHRVSRRCYRSGVDALRGTRTGRLDGHSLYSASHVPIRAERQSRRG